jgi:hypothetical protein
MKKGEEAHLKFPELIVVDNTVPIDYLLKLRE